MSGKMKLDKNSVEIAILIALVGGAVIISPMGGKVVIALARYYIKKWWDKGGPYVPPENDPEQIRQSIYRLKRNDYIKWKYNKEKKQVILELTKKGKKYFDNSKLEDITISVPDKWDAKWRFVFFDIPEKRRSFRDVLRSKLKSLGFFQFQKSVWVYPFECEGEVRYLCEYFGVTPYTMTFTAKIGNDRILRRYFLKEGVLLRRHLSLRDRGVRY